MSLSNDVVNLTRERGVSSHEVTNATTIYGGALVGKTTAGRLSNWSDTAGLLFMGFATRRAVGDTSASPPVECSVDESGQCFQKVAVTGASAQTNEGELVYATDENTFSLTPTTNVGPIGYVVRWYTSTTCDVQLYTPEEYRAWSGV